MKMKKTKVIILGGGFAGLYAAMYLDKKLARRPDMDVTLISRPMKPFTFTTLGQLATIGHHSGVATIFGMKFSGFLAWLMWRTVYLLKLPRLPKKLRVVTGWTLELLFSRDLEQMLTVRDVEALAQMAGRARKLVARGRTTTPLQAQFIKQ